MALFDIIDLTPSADVATDDTMVFNYPSGNASRYAQAGEVLVIEGLQNTVAQASTTFTVSYGSTAATVTYKGDTTIPAGTLVRFQAPLAGYEADGDITALTDSSGGAVSDTLAAITAGASYTQADMTAAKNAIASLAAKVNKLIALANA